MTKTANVVLTAAQQYDALGIAVRPVKFKSKAALDGWDRDDFAPFDWTQLVKQGCNIGAMLGPKSNGLTDLDLDCPEAVALAPFFMPKTNARFGRDGSRNSHWLYRCKLHQTVEKAAIQCTDPVSKAMLVELRIGTKPAQTVIPPSVHESGEQIRWEEGCSIDGVCNIENDEDFLQSFNKLAAATLLSQQWSEGVRNKATLALAGWLARQKWGEEEATQFVVAIAKATGDDEIKMRTTAVKGTYAKFAANKKTRGLPELKKLLDKELVSRAAAFLAPDDSNELLEELNAEYCVVKEGGKSRVLSFEEYEYIDDKFIYRRRVPTFATFPDFHNFHKNRYVLVDGEAKPLGVWWTGHPQRRTYNGLTFRPDLDEETVNGRLNLWRGYGVEPKEGDWSLLRQHVKKIIAAGNEEHDAYVMNWLAWAVQNPGKQAGVALVLLGKRGTGRGTLGNAMMHLFGQHAHQISSTDRQLQRAHAGCLLPIRG